MFREGTQLLAIVETMDSLGNPFKEGSHKLLVLEMKEIAQADMAATINGIEKAGHEQFQTFAEEHLTKQMKEVKDVIRLNQFALFRNPRKSSLKAQENIASLKQKCNLFSQLYIFCQVRQGDLDEFFAHKNQACSPSVLKFGNL